ncbi:MAG: hypothetical protein ABI395_10350 [Sphingobium sp.]
MTETAMFVADGDLYRPLGPAKGYWTRDSMHGRALVGLIGYEIDRLYGADGLIPARFNVDLHRLAPFGPVRVETNLLRDGGRLRLVEAIVYIGDVEYARGQCQLLRPATAPGGRVWAPDPWDAPDPETIDPSDDPKRRGLAEWRVVKGGFREYGPRWIWTREYHQLVEGVPLSPWTRVALSSDFGSPWAHMSDDGIHYINTDVIVQLHRLPVDEYLGYEATGHEASNGIAIGNCRLYDRQGPIGYVSATALSNVRRR